MSPNLLNTRRWTTGGTGSRGWVLALTGVAALGLAGLVFAATDGASDSPKSNLQTAPSAKAEKPTQPVVQADDVTSATPESEAQNAPKSGAPTGRTGATAGSKASLGTSGTMTPRVAPSNDDCSGAIAIPDGPYPVVTTPVDLTDATPQGMDEGILSCATTDATVWYSFTPSVTGIYTFTTCRGSGAVGSTVYDTVLGLFPSTGGSCPQGAQIACNDTASGCTSSGGGAPYWDQSSLSGLLAAGQTYFIVAGHWSQNLGGIVPTLNDVALKVDLSPAPPNDTCAGAVALTLGRAVEGTTASATNDYQSPSTTACFSGVGQTPTTSPGRDVVYSFTAPADGKYSFRVFGQNYPSTTIWDVTQDIDLYVASNCPGGGTVSCVGAANRMVSAPSTSIQNRGEEVSCLPMTAASTVYVYVDHGAAANAGQGFSIEAYPCNQEIEPNATPATASVVACPSTGSISPAGDVDFWNLGTFTGDERLYGIVDGITSNSNDYNLRITNDTDTLEFDAGDGTGIVGGSDAPQWAGTPATAGPVYLRVNQNAGIAAEPYRLQSVVEPALSSAAIEPPEPNNTFAGAGSSPGNYFYGFAGQVAADLDVYRFCADAGDLVFIGLDADPDRSGSAFNPALFGWQYNGTQIWGVSDPNSASVQTPSPGILNGQTPNSPSETLTWRARYTGVHFTGVNGQAPLTVGDYALAIGLNCQNPVRSGDPQIAVTGPTGDVATSSLVTYTVTVTNPGTMAQDVRLTDVLPPNLLFVSLSAFGSATSGLSCTTPAVGASGTIRCNNFCMAGGDTLTYTLVAQVKGCIGAGLTITNTFNLASATTDTDLSNNDAGTTFTTTDDGTCSDNDACTTGDHCEGTSCVSTGPTDCDDHSVCTEDYCDSATGCINDPTPGLQCNDGFDCTKDQCDPITGCYFPPEPAGLACNDFFPCTLNDACDGQGNCTGPQKDCDDGNSCTADSCDQATGTCVHTPLAGGSACDDGNACTTGDTCDAAAVCVPGTGTLDCNDNNPCTDDSCDPAVGCVNAANTSACDDGDACTVGDTCGGGSCNPGAPRVCNDGNGCTDDTCNPASGCVFLNNTAPCEDGSACTVGDTCGGGTCNSGAPVICTASDQCHDAGVCDPATGICSNPAKPDGTTCNDGDLCTTGDACSTGTCVGDSHINEAAPKSNGYYKRLCQGPHSGDQLTDADAACVASISATFAGIATVADICAVIEPSQPNNDKCDQTEDDLMVLALNICRARVCEAQNLESQCGSNSTVGQSLAESDGILAAPSRDFDTCSHAKCLDEEINTGRSLEVNSLTLANEGGDVRLNWTAPYLNDGTSTPKSYDVWRRAAGSMSSFTKIGSSTTTTFLDTTSGSDAWEYEITAVMK